MGGRREGTEGGREWKGEGGNEGDREKGKRRRRRGNTITHSYMHFIVSAQVRHLATFILRLQIVLPMYMVRRSKSTRK